MSKLWFSIFDFSFNYQGEEDLFIDPDRFDWATDIALHTKELKAELESYLKKNDLTSYFNNSMVSKKDIWKTIALKVWSIERYKNQEQFSFTTALINKYPQIISASFNLLEPNGTIVPHCGDTNAIYRCHLGIDIPAGLPQCGFRVKEEKRAWENGKWLIFMDAYTHEAWNNTEQPRFIFLIDVLRDEFKSKKNKVTSTVLASLFIQKRFDQLNLFKKIRSYPGTIKILTNLLRPWSLIAIYISNKLKIS